MRLLWLWAAVQVFSAAELDDEVPIRHGGEAVWGIVADKLDRLYP